ncbi:MAG TPA: PqqD family protein [Candidatus Polarisedimenticolia bacterium]|nr:PqqD family protein [Candidatus Polarisedimenticolia bacterium]
MKPERWIISDKTAYELVEGEAVALNLQTGTYYRLNAVAASALEYLPQCPALPDLTDRLLMEFDVDRPTLAADLAELFIDLERYGLVVREG